MASNHSRGPLQIVAATLSLGLLLGACGDEESASDKPQVAATTSVAADIVRELAGEDAEVTQIVPDGSSPHSYAPSAKEQQQLAESDLLVYFHPGLEAALPLEEAKSSFELAEHAGELRTYAEDEVAEGEHVPEGEEEHGDEGTDPHFWLDPLAIRATLPELADALAALDPDNASGYRQRAEAYAAELTRLDAELQRLVAAIPAADRKLVTSHDLLGYFADRYGFEVIGAVFGVSPEAEASAADVAGLIGVVEQAGVPAVFAQQGDDAQVLRLIAEETEVEVVDDLLLETLGPEADSYAEMMRFSTGRIVDALAG